MKIIDIYDNGGYRSITDDMLAMRLRMIGAVVPAGAIRRPGPAAENIGRNGAVEVLTSGFGFGSRLSMPYKVRRLSKGAVPVIIHTHSFETAEQAALIARAWDDGPRPRVVLEMHSVNELPLSNRIGFAIDSADAFIFHTSADRDQFLSYYNNVGAEKPKALLPPGFNSAEALPPHSVPDTFTLLWGGRLTSGCGLMELVDAVGALPPDGDVKIMVAGQGKAAEAVPVLRRVKQLGIGSSVEFLGDTAITPKMMEKASAMVVTSANDAFASWSVAMGKSAGLPVIMATGRRNRELVPEEGARFYVPMSDGKESLRAAIASLRSDRELLRAMSAAMQRSATDSGVTDIINFYHSLATL